MLVGRPRDNEHPEPEPSNRRLDDEPIGDVNNVDEPIGDVDESIGDDGSGSGAKAKC